MIFTHVSLIQEGEAALFYVTHELFLSLNCTTRNSAIKLLQNSVVTKEIQKSNAETQFSKLDKIV